MKDFLIQKTVHNAVLGHSVGIGLFQAAVLLPVHVCYTGSSRRQPPRVEPCTLAERATHGLFTRLCNNQPRSNATQNGSLIYLFFSRNFDAELQNPPLIVLELPYSPQM
jgi:hypothetical protein